MFYVAFISIYMTNMIKWSSKGPKSPCNPILIGPQISLNFELLVVETSWLQLLKGTGDSTNCIKLKDNHDLIPRYIIDLDQQKKVVFKVVGHVLTTLNIQSVSFSMDFKTIPKNQYILNISKKLVAIVPRLNPDYNNDRVAWEITS